MPATHPRPKTPTPLDGPGRSEQRLETAPAERGRSPRTRRHSADTRDRLLQSGLELLAHRPELKVVGLTANAVSERAGVTSGAFFHHFSTQTDYFEELVRYATTNVVVDDNIAAVYDAFADALADGSSVDAAARAVGATDLAALVEHDPTWPLAVLLFASGSERATALRSFYGVWDSYPGNRFHDLITLIGWEPRPPMGAIVRALTGDLALGSATRYSFEPDAIPAALFAAVYAALLSVLLRPVGDERTLFDLPAILGRSILGDAPTSNRDGGDNS